MRILKWVSLSLLAGFVVLGVATWLALEMGGGVAILETRTADGGLRSTHVWYIEHEGELWVEAGSPRNGWFVDVQREPRLEFGAEERRGSFVARPSPSREVHAWLREKLSERYGWRDWWVSHYVDSSHSLAVRLDPVK